MPETDSNDEQPTIESIIAKFDAGLDTSGLDGRTRRMLSIELDAASGRYRQTPIVNYPDGTPARVSWLDQHGILRHRPFDGPFPPGYPQRLAVHQCQQVLFRLLGMEENSARDRAYAMLLMAEEGLHCFDNKHGHRLSAQLTEVGVNEDDKRTVILKLHDHPGVQQLLMQRFGIEPRPPDGE